MKTITNITAIIIVFMTTFSTSYAKIRKMSAEQFDRIYKHTDKDVVGTWEKVTDYTSKKKNTRNSMQMALTFRLRKKTANIRLQDAENGW